MRQEYSKEWLQRIMDCYENFGLIREYRQLSSGFENSNYIIKTKRVEVVVKIYEGDFTRANVMLETRLMKKAYNAGVKCPYLYVNKNRKLFNSINGKFTTVMEILPGHTIENTPEGIKKGLEVTDDMVYEMGQIAGHLDKVLEDEHRSRGLRKQSAFNMNFFKTIKDRLAILPENMDKDLFKRIFDYFDLIKPNFNAMPKGLIHNDVGPQNFLVVNGHVQGLIDFSQFAFSPYIQNIAIALLNICFNYRWNPAQAQHFLKGYREFRKVSRQEIDLLQYLIAARYATVILEFNYWNKKVFKEDKERQQLVQDQYEFLKRFLDLDDDVIKVLGKRSIMRKRGAELVIAR